MYKLMKPLWFRSPQSSRSSPEKSPILKSYEQIQHRILVEDPVLADEKRKKNMEDFVTKRLEMMHQERQRFLQKYQEDKERECEE
ncbi:Hypothetical protein SMAX5B_002626 [Scophthalmus maximus]|uniref:Uncharacterized protein n=1 Tax=Scophthalmus maximus TaxID=52904 RepID=A0A2U9BY79_SCOMX|nr:Hypothetical protein SMAX5B_002626 [Scophthalmus maximus]